MSYRQSPHFLEAQRRANLMRRARTPLGHYWQQKQLVAELKAMIEATRTEGRGLRTESKSGVAS